MDERGNRENARASLQLYRSEPGPCPYLPERASASEGFAVAGLPSTIYEQLMNLGFRRSGQYVYRPVCGSCHECVPLRVPIETFVPSRSQRRALRRNEDVAVSVGEPVCDDEKWRMYTAYIAHQHDGAMSTDREDFAAFLYAKVTDTIEMTYRIGPRIVGIGLCDVCSDCLSSVYFFFDPVESRRSLGTYSVLMEIDECRRRGLSYWYAGYYVRDCSRMSYKSAFRPNELLVEGGRWRAAD